MWNIFAKAISPTKSSFSSFPQQSPSTAAASSPGRPSVDTKPPRKLSTASYSSHTRSNSSTSTMSNSLSIISTAPSSRGSARRGRVPTSVVCLLDGDGDYFKLEMLQQGFQGGRKAAIELHRRLQLLVKEREGAEARGDVLMMLMWNKTGLQQFLAGEEGGRGLDLTAFAQGFSSSPFAAVAVDTGYTSQSADEAIKAHLRVQVKMADLVVLGGTHDSGYAATLHHLDLEDPAYLRKILLLRTSPYCAPALVDLKMEEIWFLGLFEGRGPVFFSPRGGRKLPLPSTPRSASSDAVVSSKTKPIDEMTKATVAGAAEVPAKPPPPTTCPSASNTRRSTKTVPSHPSPIKTQHVSPLNKFQPLLDVLRELLHSGKAYPPKSLVDDVLRKKHTRVLYGSFNVYLREATRIGLVETGGSGAEWVTLHQNYRSLVSTSETHSSAKAAATSKSITSEPSDDPPLALPPLKTPFSITTYVSPAAMTDKSTTSDAFLPLVALLRKQQAKGLAKPLRSQIGGMLTTKQYQAAGVSTFKDYATEAQKLGLVKLGGPAAGAEWIQLVL